MVFYEKPVLPLLMRRDILITALIAVVVIVLIILIVPMFTGPSSATITSVSTDKNLYHSNEIMKIAISLSARGPAENATIKLSGIQDKYGNFRLEKELPVTLSSGSNTVIYDYQLPSCSSCAGLLPGSYPIEVQLVRNGTVVANATHSIQLEQ
jgi:hypothetical protein